MQDNKQSRLAFLIILGLMIISLSVLPTLSGCGGDKPTNTPDKIIPQIELTNLSECKDSFDENDLTASGSGQICVEFIYDIAGVLFLRHTDMTANCCADSFSVEIDVENGIITIVEKEIFLVSPCHCVCPYDIEMEIRDLAPGTYTISIIEPYQHPGSPALEFGITLEVPVSGQFCIFRE
ncbi:MAG: hypothetical protein ABIE07_03570 [Candidatus Zixiibacteriota bacterium]